jgi:hypothetical protein
MSVIRQLWEDLKSVFLFWFTASDSGFAGIDEIKPKGLK